MLGVDKLPEKVRFRIILVLLSLTFLSIFPAGLTLNYKFFWFTGIFFLLFIVFIILSQSSSPTKKNKNIEWIEPRHFVKLKHQLEYENINKLKIIKFKHVFLFSIIFIPIMSYWSSTKMLFNTFIPFIFAFLIAVIFPSLIIIFLEYMATLNITITLGDHHLVILRSGENPKVYDINKFDNYKILSGEYKGQKYKAIQFNGLKPKLIFLNEDIKLGEIRTFLTECELKEI